MTTTTDTTAARIAAIEARVAAAIEGPWHECQASQGQCECGLVWADEFDAVVARIETDGDMSWGAENIPATATFIAHAREDVPWLIAELRAARTELQRLADCEPAHRARVLRLLADGEVGE